MRLLGAILSGGLSSRFGSDKAFALLDGIPLVEHVRAALAPQVDALVSCGRPLLDLEGLSDRPGPGLGPLGGLAAALHAATERGFDAVLSTPCDTPYLPADLRDQLTVRQVSYVADAPVIGCWPSRLAPLLDRFIAQDARRSMRAWSDVAGAVAVRLQRPIANINRPSDLLQSG